MRSRVDLIVVFRFEKKNVFIYFDYANAFGKISMDHRELSAPILLKAYSCFSTINTHNCFHFHFFKSMIIKDVQHSTIYRNTIM